MLKLLLGNIKSKELFFILGTVDQHFSSVLSVRVTGKVKAADIKAHPLPLGMFLDKASRLTIQDV